MSYDAGYQAGYNAANAEIYAAIDTEDHVSGCGEAPATTPHCTTPRWPGL